MGRVRSAALGAVLVLVAGVPVQAGAAPQGAPRSAPPPGYGEPYPIDVQMVAGNGEGRIEAPGRACADGGDGAYWHYDYGADLAAGKFSQLLGQVRTHLDLHSDTSRFPNSSPTPPGPDPRGFLLEKESHASFLNVRGAAKLRLNSGSCATPSLNFNGSNASGGGAWSIPANGGSGAYRNIIGSGTFTLTNAEVNPGADNALSLRLLGTVQVLQPTLRVEVVRAYWGGLGTDYLTRRVTVVYKITNDGPGDAFGAVFAATSSPSAGVTPVGFQPKNIGDLPVGDTATIQARYQLGLLAPCALIILNCPFNATVGIHWTDALDVATPQSRTVSTKAPNFPPPL
jgi:hypothetical protein